MYFRLTVFKPNPSERAMLMSGEKIRPSSCQHPHSHARRYPALWNLSDLTPIFVRKLLCRWLNWLVKAMFDETLRPCLSLWIPVCLPTIDCRLLTWLGNWGSEFLIRLRQQLAIKRIDFPAGLVRVQWPGWQWSLFCEGCEWELS